MSVFVDLAILKSPRFLLRNKWGGNFVKNCVQAVDDFMASLRNAAQCGMVAWAPVDALPAIAWERADSIQYPGETTAAWRLRLQQLWRDMVWMGTDHGVSIALQRLGCAVVILRGSGAAWDELRNAAGIPGLVRFPTFVPDNDRPLYHAQVWIVVTSVPTGVAVAACPQSYATIPESTYADWAAARQTYCGYSLQWVQMFKREANRWLASDVERRSVKFFELPHSRIGCWPAYSTYLDLPPFYSSRVFTGDLNE